MNVSLLRDSKLLHGQERRGSRMSVRAPSRQPSMASLRPHSPNPSLGKTGLYSITRMARTTSDSYHGEFICFFALIFNMFVACVVFFDFAFDLCEFCFQTCSDNELNQPSNQSTNQSNKSINQPTIYQSINQPVSQSASQSISQSPKQATKHITA